MDVKIVNTGTYSGSGFFATVTGVSEPIPTKNLKIVTSWSAHTIDVTTSVGIANNSAARYGATVLPDVNNTNTIGDPTIPIGPGLFVAPFGGGAGGQRDRNAGGVDTNMTSYSETLAAVRELHAASGNNLVGPRLWGSRLSLWVWCHDRAVYDDRLPRCFWQLHTRANLRYCNV